MSANTLHIKNMVCGRCIKVVREELENLGYPVNKVELGKVEFEGTPELDKELISKTLEKEGFELIDDQSTRIINKVKTLIIDQVHHSHEGKQINLSDYLEKEVGKSYSSITSLFSKVEGRTIEKYAIMQRIERVKELLIYDEKTVSEIAWEMGYSSGQYLSNQFKSETGLSPTEFRTMHSRQRKPLDEV